MVNSKGSQCSYSVTMRLLLWGMIYSVTIVVHNVHLWSVKMFTFPHLFLDKNAYYLSNIRKCIYVQEKEKLCKDFSPICFQSYFFCTKVLLTVFFLKIIFTSKTTYKYFLVEVIFILDIMPVEYYIQVVPISSSNAGKIFFANIFSYLWLSLPRDLLRHNWHAVNCT